MEVQLSRKHTVYSSSMIVAYLALLVLTDNFTPISCRERVYFIGAVEDTWDYAPTGINQINKIKLDSDSDASVFTKKGVNRIGKVYKKAMFREFTDLTFTKQKPHPSHLGIFGPVIKGEVNDDIIVYFKNMGSRNYSVHPHGVFYQKSSEGALYHDKTTGFDKGDDHVPPQGQRKYLWTVAPAFAPAEGDPNCLTWLYHSHVNPVKDTNTGLMGTILTCKKGHLDQFGKRNDVDKEFFLLFTVLDENKSWFLDDNLRANSIDPAKINKEDEGFMESNLFHGINGRFYGNLEGIDMCLGDTVSWHLSGLGNEVDIHTAYFHGNTIVANEHRTDVEVLFPARSLTASMQVRNIGKWMLSCQVADHYSAGMIAFYNVKDCKKKITEDVISNPKQRMYYIAAEEIIWDYAPSGKNLFDGGNLTTPGSSSATFFDSGPTRIGGRYLKAIYREYTNATFAELKSTANPKDSYMGILGPVIRAEVGDTITVFFKNKGSIPFSVHPHGVVYNKQNEGSLYNDGTEDKKDDKILPNGTYTYHWTVPSSVRPTDNDAPCISYFYSSSVDPIKDTYSGLLGPLVICKKGSLGSDLKPLGFKNERFLYFAVMDENKSWYLNRNMDQFCTKPKCNGISKEDEGFAESNKMHQINGFMYGNLPKLNICKDEKVLWHLIGMGTEVDMHTVYFHGNSLDDFGNHKDTVFTLPGTFATFSMTPDNPGKWGLVCRTNDHYNAGMKVFYTVDNCTDTTVSRTGKLRTYHIGIVEREWDYAPTNRNLIRDHLLDEIGRDSRTFVHRGPKSIGKVYKKALYRAFTSSNFSQERNRTEDEKHLGVLGPVIIAEEGDEIKVVLKNMATRKYSIHPHGLFYSKMNEGSFYEGNKDNGVSPGSIRTYTWLVPSRASPGRHDSACLTWAYYSSINPVKDTNTGLVGPLIICRKGTLDNESKRKDVHRAFAMLFTVLDENESWYIDDNIKTFLPKGALINKEDATFMEGNKMHSINGYIYGNGQHFVMTDGERVDWYLIGLGNEVDMHTVHFHGQTFIHRTYSKHREDVYDLFPGIFTTLEMQVSSPGNWLLHCHVNDHIEGGMETIYKIKARGTTVDPGNKNNSGARLQGCAVRAVLFVLLAGLTVIVVTLF